MRSPSRWTPSHWKYPRWNIPFPRVSSPVFLALLFEGGLGAAALALAWITQLPLGPWPGEGPGWLSLDSSVFWGIGWGLLGTIPLLTLLLAVERAPIRAIRELAELVRHHLGPLLEQAPWWQLGLLALLAGVGEELLFRGWLQHGVGGWLFGSPDGWASILMAGVAFGVCHAVTRTYAIVAGLVGVYLGWLQSVSGHLLAPIVAHGTYDFIALLYLLRAAPRNAAAPGPE
jgi:uncharacterized protein